MSLDNSGPGRDVIIGGRCGCLARSLRLNLGCQQAAEDKEKYTKKDKDYSVKPCFHIIYVRIPPDFLFYYKRQPLRCVSTKVRIKIRFFLTGDRVFTDRQYPCADL